MHISFLEKLWRCKIIKQVNEKCFEYTQFHLLKDVINGNTPAVTNLSECLKKGLSAIMIGRGTETFSQSDIDRTTEKGKYVACVVLDSKVRHRLI